MHFEKMNYKKTEMRLQKASRAKNAFGQCLFKLWQRRLEVFMKLLHSFSCSVGAPHFSLQIMATLLPLESTH
jgi:hypothetical protein